MEYLLFVVKGTKPWGLYCTKRRMTFHITYLQTDCASETIVDCRKYLAEKYGYTLEQMVNVPQFGVSFVGELEMEGTVAKIKRRVIKLL